MFAKKSFQFILFAAIMLMSLAPTAAQAAPAAYSACGTSYTVQWGDTLGKIALRCGTNIAALQLANPSIGSGYWIYAGQVLLLPGASFDNGNGYSTYVVARGDTLKSIANRYGTTMDVLASLNGIYNYNLIYEGQRLVVTSGGSSPAPAPQPAPGGGGTYVVQWGDTMRKIADRFGISLTQLLALNPQVQNPNWIYNGQVLNVPAGAAAYYTVQYGDTMKIIAARYGTSLSYLLSLNPQIWNADWIYVGQVIRVR
jgi:peptidoglycan endopeptidase LytE